MSNLKKQLLDYFNSRKTETQFEFQETDIYYVVESMVEATLNKALNSEAYLTEYLFWRDLQKRLDAELD